MKALITIIDDDDRVIEENRLIEPTQHNLRTISGCVYEEYKFEFTLEMLRSFGEEAGK
ncbi:MAG: hypothetical protein KBT02_10305 [Treponema sp.]|nr:hypothetical protein [Candidatus Treponema caballi]